MIKRIAHNKKTKDVVLKEFQNIHGDLYDYSLVDYKDSHSKIMIICRIHGIFKQTPYKHRSKRGCPDCAVIKRAENRRLTKEQFVQKSIKIHGEIYDYSLVEYENGRQSVKIICKNHGVFEQTPDKHTQGHSCPECSIIKRGLKCRKSINEFIDQANKVHNNLYDYSQVNYEEAHRKIEIICKKHGTFWQTPHNHLRGNGLTGNGCPSCSMSYRISDISQKWLKSLNIENLILEYRLPEIALYVDGYDPSTNTVYQFHGDYWHGNPTKYKSDDINPQNKKTYGELYVRTQKIDAQIRSLKYNLITIWESEYRKQQL